MLGVWMVGRVGRPDLRIDGLVNLCAPIQCVWCVLYFHGIVITVVELCRLAEAIKLHPPALGLSVMYAW